MSDQTSAPETIDVELAVTVRVTIKNPAVIARAVNDEQGFQRMFGPTTRDEVLEHLAWNAVANGRHSLHGLDGWADLDYNDAQMDVRDATLLHLDYP